MAYLNFHINILNGGCAAVVVIVVEKVPSCMGKSDLQVQMGNGKKMRSEYDR
jgi:hypothetical protein